MSVGFKLNSLRGCGRQRPIWLNDGLEYPNWEAHWGDSRSFRQAPCGLAARPVLAGRSPCRPTEHGAERAHAFIAEIEGDLGHRIAAAQPAHGLEHPRLLAPGTEAEAGLALEAAGEGAGA